MATRISYSTIVDLNNKDIYSTPFIQDYYDDREHNLPKYEDTILLTKRILNLSLRRKIDGAKKIFDGMLCKDIVAWNAMIRGFMENHMINHA